MAYLDENWKRCKKCGSYMPPEWTKCGRCGYPANGRAKHRGGGWLFFLILIISLFVFRNQLANLIPSDVKEQFSDIFSGSRQNAEAPETRNPGKNLAGDAGPSAGASRPGENKPVNAALPAPSDKSASDGEKEAEIQSLIHDALKKAESSVEVPVLNSGDDSGAVFDIIQRIVLEDPEVMYYEGCTYRSDGLVTFKYQKPRDTILKSVDELNGKADEILGKIIEPGMSDYRKELAIHDYIVSACRYDVENFKKDTVPPEGNEAYGPLIDGKAVCGGYAKAMKLLLDKAGIESLIVSGNSKGDLHAWNIVKLSGKYYQVDATWDDPVMNNGGQVLEHTYFNVTDKDLSADHSWAKADYPACSGTAYNYFYVNKLVASTADEFTSIVGKAFKNGEDHVSIRLSGLPSGESDVEGLIKKAARQLKIGSFSYIVNEDYKVVDLWF